MGSEMCIRDRFIDAVPQLNWRLDTIRLVPHLKAITVVTDEMFVKENFLQVHDQAISEKCENLAHISKMHCEFNVAKTYFTHSLAIKLEKLGPQHVNVATSYHNLAIIHKHLGDLKQAKEYQQRALKIKLDKLGPEHVYVCLLYTSPSPRDGLLSRMPSSA